MEYEIVPKVDQSQEYIEITYDFSSPLDIVREAISNSFDAHANVINILFSVKKIDGDDNLVIELSDNGEGMDKNGLQSFFDLGNSTRRDYPANFIGEKGHGTKIYFNSLKIVVETIHASIKRTAILENPKRSLHSHVIPTVKVSEEISEEPNGTKIIITGYNNNDRERFSHLQLKDYILWFTKMGSIEKEFGIETNKDVVLFLKGVDKSSVEQPEKISFGHVFPNETPDINKLWETYAFQASSMYCSKVYCKKGISIPGFPDKKFDAVFYVEGNKVKQGYNPMLRHKGYQAPSGSYTVQDRYGLWLCKDYIPIQRKENLVSEKGSEYTKFHAFVNFQDFCLTANRSSVENTPSDYLDALYSEITKIYKQIVSSENWINMDWLDKEAESVSTINRENKEYKLRTERINRTKIADFTYEPGKTIRLVEPQQENGVYSMFLILKTLKPELFPFTILDYDTHSGIDVVVREDGNTPISSTKLFYVEFKNVLQKQFNHSFKNTKMIICWDIDTKIIKHGEEVEDVELEKRKFQIIQPNSPGGVTKYFLDNPSSPNKIEILVLKTYLKEKLGIDFRPRTSIDSF